MTNREFIIINIIGPLVIFFGTALVIYLRGKWLQRKWQDKREHNDYQEK